MRDEGTLHAFDRSKPRLETLKRLMAQRGAGCVRAPPTSQPVPLTGASL
jgi:hypothetical protein